MTLLRVVTELSVPALQALTTELNRLAENIVYPAPVLDPVQLQIFRADPHTYIMSRPHAVFDINLQQYVLERLIEPPAESSLAGPS